jgi:nitrate reductase gamma subunit
MTAATLFFALLFYTAFLLCVVGLVYKIADYARTPAPLKIPTTPAPTTSGGVVLRMLREVTLFESLFKANLWIWLFGFMFHVALALVLLRHLRYFTEPVWSWVVWIQPFGIYGGLAMVAGLAALWGRRFLVERIRYISTVSDHLMLALLIGIGISGLSMKFVVHTDIISVKEFFLGLMRFDLQPLPVQPLLFVHLTLVALLIAIFPYSKLLHAPGLFFSPGRNQVDDSRERRHLAPWAAELEKAKS